MSIKKMEEEVTKFRKDNRELKKEIKELKTHNLFLLDRLEQWAERNFQERQKWMNMTLDEVLILSKTKADYTQAKELAKTVEEIEENQSKVNSKGLA